LSERIASDLKVEPLLHTANLQDILEDDLFQLVDLRIVSELVSLLVQGGIGFDRLTQVIKQRENKYWYKDFEDFYACLLHAGELMDLVSAGSRNKETNPLVPMYFAEGVTQYTERLFRIDYCYRKLILHFRRCNQNRVLAPLAEKVEKVYSNDWLLPFNDGWQTVVSGMESWQANGADGQQRFFSQHVKPHLGRGQRLFVVISDALRFECGWEFAQRIQRENRYEAQVDFMVASLPSYTQLGMASLLPHSELQIQVGSDLVFADGMSTQGTAARGKVLDAHSGVAALAIAAEEFMKINSAEGRELIKNYELIYVYHDQIDKMGDDKTTEDKVFEAVESELDFLLDLVKKIANVNGTNILVTADHGFIYQHQTLDESDFSEADVQGEVWKLSRRYVLGRGLRGNASVQGFTAGQLGLSGDVAALIPKSINRLRVKGAGSRFIHGGSSLQEVIVPLVKINKRRQDTTSQVRVDIIKSTDKITTSLLTVSFLQADLVDAKTLPRTIRAAIYAADGSVLSDLFTYHFDKETGSERQREVKHHFQMSSKASDSYKNQRVKLILEEPVEGSQKWKPYESFEYTLNISFTSDFDDL
jgi:uncharacterized protein (TIGR02687 family)